MQHGVSAFRRQLVVVVQKEMRSDAWRHFPSDILALALVLAIGGLRSSTHQSDCQSVGGHYWQYHFFSSAIPAGDR